MRKYSETVDTPENKRQRCIVRKYGMTLDGYRELSDSQNGKCAICGNDNGGISLCIDHDHKTGKVRGLLCTLCNKGLGHFEDDKLLLLSAIDYLEAHESVKNI